MSSAKFGKRASDPQPFVDVSIRAVPSDMESLGFQPRLSNPTATTLYRGLADTGCQSCLAGITLLLKLGLNRHHLIPVSMKMTAADNRVINIIGALVLRIFGTSPSGRTLETRQLVYFTDSTDKLFLSKQACVTLGIIPETFPTIGETHKFNNALVASHASSESQPTPTHHSCSCLKRQSHHHHAPPHDPFLPLRKIEQNLRNGCWGTTSLAHSTYVNINHSL